MTERPEGLDDLLDYVADNLHGKPEVQIVGRIMRLTDEQRGWLHTAHLACERLNESLGESNSPYRWKVLSSGDPRRVREDRKL